MTVAANRVRARSTEGSFLALVRHGRSSHVQAGWITASGFEAWRRSYEAAGIRDDERVPDDLAQLVDPDTLVICSDAPRAVATARLLAPGREIITTPLLAELELAGPRWGGLRMPLVAWAVAVGARALVARLRRQYPSRAEATRIADAAALIHQLAMLHPRVVVVTHASFRQLLGKRLARTGWRAASRHRSMKHWSSWLFTRTSRASSPSE